MDYPYENERGMQFLNCLDDILMINSKQVIFGFDKSSTESGVLLCIKLCL